MYQDIVPNKRDARYRWYKNISTNVVAEGVKFDAAPADALAMKATVDGIMAKMDATETAQKVLGTTRQLEATQEKAGLAQVRVQMKNWKTLPGWAASGSSTVLQMDSTSTPLNPDTYQTHLTASLVPGGVRLDFSKNGVEGMAFYGRVVGVAAWHKVGTCNHSPFIDHAPLAVAGVSEMREYMARGVVNDAELPLDSDPVIIQFPG